MSVRLELKQIKYDATLQTPALVVVSGTERVYDPSNSTEDIYPRNVGQISETLEHEEGLYRMSDFSITVSELGEDYFSDYSDPIAQPYILIVKEDGVLVWHGIVDPDTITFNQKTKLTNFSVTSWNYILKNIDAAARSVYETEFVQRPTFDGDSGFLWVLDEDAANIDFGDVAVIETETREVRTTILDKNDISGDYTKLEVGGGNAENKVSVLDGGGATLKKINESGSSRKYRYRLIINSREAVNNITALNRSLYISIGGYDPGGVDGGPNDDGTLRIYPDRIFSEDNETVKIDGEVRDIGDGSRVTTDEDTNVSWVAYQIEYGSPSLSKQLAGIERGDRVRFLGNDIYGYTEGTTAGTNALTDDYDAESVIDALFQLRDFGILKHIYNSTSIASGDSLYLEKFLEYPQSPLEALSLIMNTLGVFLKFDYNLDGNGFPQFDNILIERGKTNTTDLANTTISSSTTGTIESWTEDGAKTTVPKAVVVKTFKDYMKPNDSNEGIGWWFDRDIDNDGVKETPEDLSSTDRELLGVPEGDDILEFDVNLMPAWEGNSFSGSGEPVVNDTRLREIAKLFFEYYVNLKRVASFDLIENEISGKRVNEYLGEFITASDVGRTVFVEESSMGILGREGSMKGRIGTYTKTVSSTPTARITGDDLFIIPSGDSTVTAVFGARTSYDVNYGQRDLTYSWSLKDSGSTEVATGTGLRFSTTLDATNEPYTVELTVTNPDSNSDTDTLSVNVGLQDTEGFPGPVAEILSSSLNLKDDGTVTATWHGDGDTDTVDVEYDTDSGFGSSSTHNGGSTGQEVTLQTISPGETLYVRFKPKNVDGNFGPTIDAAKTRPQIDSADLADGSVISSKLEQAAQKAGFTGSFTATSNNDVDWTAGSMEFADGSSASINAGSATNISGVTYVYYDGTADFSTTGSLATATQNSNVLVAVLNDSADTNQEAFIVPVVGEPTLNSDHISPASVSTAKLQATAVTAAKADIADIFAQTITVGGDLKSDNFDSGTNTGWRIKGGTSPVLELYDAVIHLASGSNGIANLGDSGDLATLDQVNTTTITDDAITTPKIATDAVIADKIDVNDLNALNATIASWEITSDVIQRTDIGTSNLDLMLGTISGTRKGFQAWSGTTGDPSVFVGIHEGDGPEIYGYSGSDWLFRLGHTNEIAGWSFDTSKLTSPNSNIVIDADSEKISIENATFTQAGVQLTYDGAGSTGKFYVGDGGTSASDVFFLFDPTNDASNPIKFSGDFEQSRIINTISIPSGGEIKQGSGTLGTDFTGLRIWHDSGIGRIAGYNSDTIQWSANTNGKLTAAGGDLVLDANGLKFPNSTAQITENSVVWESSGTVRGYINSYLDGSGDNVMVMGVSTSLFGAPYIAITTEGGDKFETAAVDEINFQTGLTFASIVQQTPTISFKADEYMMDMRNRGGGSSDDPGNAPGNPDTDYVRQYVLDDQVIWVDDQGRTASLTLT